MSYQVSTLGAVMVVAAADSGVEPDVLRFPVLLLTAGALADGIVGALEMGYEDEAECRRRRATAARCVPGEPAIEVWGMTVAR